MQKVGTLEELHSLVLEIGVCGIFKERPNAYPRLWDILDFPDAVTAGSSRRGLRMDRVWSWKNELPAMFPEDIFYGKMANGDAVLMSVPHLREPHYVSAYQPVSQNDVLARQIFESVCLEPGIATGELKNMVMDRIACTRSAFSTALKKLQISLNIARSPESPIQTDHWLRFSELFPDLG